MVFCDYHSFELDSSIFKTVYEILFHYVFSMFSCFSGKPKNNITVYFFNKLFLGIYSFMLFEKA